MDKSSGFDERLATGRQVETKVEDYMRSFGFEVVNNTVDPNDKKSIFDNLVWGDTWLKVGPGDNDWLKFDEKFGSFISQKSWSSYKGQYYILTPNGDITEEGIRNAHVLRSSTVKGYAAKLPSNRIRAGLSGDLGYRFHRLKNFITLEEFMLSLVKSKLMFSNHREGINWINKKIIKVLPKNAMYDMDGNPLDPEMF